MKFKTYLPLHCQTQSQPKSYGHTNPKNTKKYGHSIHSSHLNDPNETVLKVQPSTKSEFKTQTPVANPEQMLLQKAS